MRRLDVLIIGIFLLISGGGAYLILRAFGLETIDAGVWSQLLLFVGLIGWLSTYIFRASTKNMTYNQQVKDYEEAWLQKKYDELSPEELAKLQAEVEAERSQQKD